MKPYSTPEIKAMEFTGEDIVRTSATGDNDIPDNEFQNGNGSWLLPFFE